MMTPWSIILDPRSEDAANVPLELVGLGRADGLFSRNFRFPTPELESQYAGSVDTEGDEIAASRYRNRVIPMDFRLVEDPAIPAMTNLVENPGPTSLTGYDDTGSTFINPCDLGGPDFIVDTDGRNSIRFQTDIAPGLQGVRYSALVGDTFVGGTTHYCLVKARADAAGPAHMVFGNQSADSVNPTINLTTEYQWFLVSWTPTADRTSVCFALRSPSAGAANTYYFRNLMITTTAGPVYIDGDTPGANWNGTVGLSSSTLLPADGSRLAAAMRDLNQKLAKIQAEGGTMKVTPPDRDPIVFDLQTVRAGESEEHRAGRRVERNGVEFEAKPLGRGPLETIAGTAELALPYLTFVVPEIKGDATAHARLRLDENDGDDQLFVIFGIESRYYSADADAALFYQAESRTPLGGAATAVGSGTPSGAGSNVVRQGTLTLADQAMLSTQASGGGAHLEHVGLFHLWGRFYRPATNTGEVTVRLDHSTGDFRRWTAGPETTFAVDDREGEWVLVDLGLVDLPKVVAGAQRWEGRVVARSTVLGDDLDCDCLFVVPALDGYGEIRAAQQFDVPTAFSARDGFDQTAGALAGKQAPVPSGGTGVWAGVGDADDFTVETTGHTAQRTAVSDADPGRIETLPFNIAATVVQVDFKCSVNLGSTNLRQKVIARFADVDNYFSAGIANGTTAVTAERKVASVAVPVAGVTVAPFVAGVFYSLRLLVAANGRWFLWFWMTGTAPGPPVLFGYDAALATGGALATGRPGFRDNAPSATAATRNYKNFMAFSPVVAAAIFANQSLEIRHDRAIREDSTGVLWTDMPVDGDYLKLPPSRNEKRPLRVFAKASRGIPETMADPGIDDLGGQLLYTPRYLEFPG